MPTYDYECGACSHQFELFQMITAKPVKKCPSCGKLKAKRLIGAGGTIIFKGSGFYQTDYRSEGYKKAAKAEADAMSGGDKKKDKSDKSDKSAKTDKPDKTKGSSSEPNPSGASGSKSTD